MATEYLTSYRFIPENADDATRVGRKMPLIIPAPVEDDDFDNYNPQKRLSQKERAIWAKEVQKKWLAKPPVRLARVGAPFTNPQVYHYQPSKPVEKRGSILEDVAAQPTIIPAEKITYWTMDDYKRFSSEGVALPTAPEPASVTALTDGWQIGIAGQLNTRQELWVAITTGDDRLPWRATTTMWRGLTTSLDVTLLPSATNNHPFVVQPGRSLSFEGTLTSYPLLTSGSVLTDTTVEDVSFVVNGSEVGNKSVSASVTITVVSNSDLDLTQYSPTVRYFVVTVAGDTDRDRYHVLQGTMEQLPL